MLARRSITFAAIDGRAACRLDDIKQSIAGLLPENFADHGAEIVDVVAERRILLVKFDILTFLGRTCRGMKSRGFGGVPDGHGYSVSEWLLRILRPMTLGWKHLRNIRLITGILKPLSATGCFAGRG